MGLTFNGTSVTAVNYNGTALSKISFNGTEVWSSGPNAVCFTAKSANSSVSLTQEGSGTRPIAANYSYTTDGTTWYTVSLSTASSSGVTITLANIGDKVWFKGNNPNFTNAGSYYTRFITTGDIKVSGDINTLLFEDGPQGPLPECTYYRLFYNNLGLTDASELIFPSEIIGYRAYSYMFYGCENLINGPVALPAIQLGNESYNRMFYGCGSMISGPAELPASVIPTNAYEYMFYRTGCPAPCIRGMIVGDYGCYHMFDSDWGVTIAPELFFTSIGQYGCAYMFNYCYNLTQCTTNLPALSISAYAYEYMFSDCSSLINPPIIRATTWSDYCFFRMFYKCTSLVSASPWAYGIDYGNFDYEDCCVDMYYNCSSLVRVPVFPVSIRIQLQHCQDMFYGCSSLIVSDTSGTGYSNAWRFPQNGTFSTLSTQNNMFYRCAGTRSSNNMPGAVGSSYTYYTQNAPLEPLPNYLSFVALQENSSVTMFESDSPGTTYYYQYSTDLVNWTSVSRASDGIYMTQILANIGDRIYIKGTNSRRSGGTLQFSVTGKLAVSGDVTTLIDPNGNVASLASRSGVGQDMFYNCVGLYNGGIILPSTTLAQDCYHAMFQGCTDFKVAPELPALTVNSYAYTYMFYGSGVEIPSVLPATSIGDSGYARMYGLSAVRSVPNIAATTIGSSGCYQMFQYCSNLKDATATIAASSIGNSGCLGMFTGCANLITPPTMPNLTSVGSRGCSMMFADCISLTSAPALLATTLGEYCYNYMFMGCTSLIASPSLPATALQKSCYASMFNGCTSLVTAPRLSATALVTGCYHAMFQGCSSLQVWSTSGIGHIQTWRIPTSGTITATSFQAWIFSECAGTRSSDNLEGTAGSAYTYYTQNAPV